MSIEERRSSLRAPVAISVTEEYQNKEQSVTATDICEHGMKYIRPMDQFLRSGEEVLLTFSLMDKVNQIKVLSWVVEERKEKDHISTHVTFMFLPENDETAIRNFVTAKTSISDIH